MCFNMIFDFSLHKTWHDTLFINLLFRVLTFLINKIEIKLIY